MHSGLSQLHDALLRVEGADESQLLQSSHVLKAYHSHVEAGLDPDLFM